MLHISVGFHQKLGTEVAGLADAATELGLREHGNHLLCVWGGGGGGGHDRKWGHLVL